MSAFDALDQLASEAVGAVLNERLIWRPMVSDPNNILTGEDRGPDPERPVRGEDDDPLGPLEAIVTWRVSTVAVGTGGDTPSGVVMADCVVDFDVRAFQNEAGGFDMPQKGDVFELVGGQFSGESVQVDQRGDDGAARLMFYCSSYS